MKKTRLRRMTQSAMIAALYVLLTYLSSLLGLSSGAVQCRLSEALCVLPLYTPAAIPGLMLGCLIANFVTGALPPDLVFGTLATAMGAVGCHLIGRGLRRDNVLRAVLATLPNLVANTLIIPPVLRYAYGLQDAYWILAVQVGLGELIAGTVLGAALALSLPRVWKHHML